MQATYFIGTKVYVEYTRNVDYSLSYVSLQNMGNTH